MRPARVISVIRPGNWSGRCAAAWSATRGMDADEGDDLTGADLP